MTLSYQALSEMNNSMDNELTDVYDELFENRDLIVALKGSAIEQAKLLSVARQEVAKLKLKGYH